MATTGVFESREVSDYVIDVLGLTPGKQSRLIAVKFNKAVADPVSIVAHALKYIEHKPSTMRTIVNDSKFCVDDKDGLVYVLVHLEHIPFRLRKWVIGVADVVVSVFEVQSIAYRSGSCKAFMDIPIRIKVWFFISISFLLFFDCFVVLIPIFIFFLGRFCKKFNCS